MARVKDFAIPMDEFHPNPSTAAAFADRKANDATTEHLTTALKRINTRLETEPQEFHHVLRLDKSELEALLSQTKADRVEIDRRIEEAKVK